jgi:hypothetical protein
MIRGWHPEYSTAYNMKKMPTFEKFAKKIPPHASNDKERCK